MRKLRWIPIFIAAVLCMLLTACAIRSASAYQTESFKQTPITPSDILFLPMNDRFAPSKEFGEELLGVGTEFPENWDASAVPTDQQTDNLPTTTPAEDGLPGENPVFTTAQSTENSITKAPVTTGATQTPETTAPVTTKKPTTTAPVTTQKPITTTAPVTTQKPITTAPVTDGENGTLSPIPKPDGFWFDDVVFLGDSITAGLSLYAQNGVLGNAAFVATPGYSVKDAISPVWQSNPNVYYDGVAMRPEECIALSGKSKVYIMLGINDLCYGVNSTLTRYRELIANIQSTNPDVIIYVQSITPITSTCSIVDSNLNNDNIRRYNQLLEALCGELGMVYLDVASVMYDDEGVAFRREFCKDADGMGMHYTSAGYACWVEYLLAHTVSSDNEV